MYYKLLLTKCIQLSPFKIISIATLIIFISGVILIIPIISTKSFLTDFDISNLSIWWIISPLFFYVLGDGLMLPNLISTALQPYKQCAGSAASLAGFCRFFIGAVIAMIVTFISKDSLETLHVGMAIMAFIATIIYLVISLMLNPSKTDQTY